MFVLALTVAAYAEPPRGEVAVGFAGNTSQGYGFATAQPSVARNDEASFVVRGTVSQLYYTWEEAGAEHRVDSPGASIGPGFVYSPGDLSLGASVSFEVRRPTTRAGSVEGTTDTELGATLGTNLYWRPGGHSAALYGLMSFSGANEYLWARAGVIHPIIPMFRDDTAAALWLGADATTSGNDDTRALEFGAVAEVPIRDLGAAFSLRGGLMLLDVDSGDVGRMGTLGAGIYWRY